MFMMMSMFMMMVMIMIIHVHVKGEVQFDGECLVRATIEEEPLDDAGEGVGDVVDGDILHLQLGGHRLHDVGGHDALPVG